MRMKIVVRDAQNTEQIVNVKPIALIRRNASGGCVRLFEKPHSSSSPITLRIVAELRPEAFANLSAIAFDPTGSPVTKCSLIIAVRIDLPARIGKIVGFSRS